MIITKKIKPLSVNKCWRGRRFKTPEYKSYEQELLYTLPTMKLPKPPLKIHFTFGFSNAGSDWDNPIKPLQDILAKKYGFDDKDIHCGMAEKIKTKKGDEFFRVEISTIKRQ